MVKACESLSHRALIYRKKLDIHEKRKEFRKANYLFQLNRSRFYRSLEGDESKTSTADRKVVAEYWTSMWMSPEVEEFKWCETLKQCQEQANQSLLRISLESDSIEKDILDIISRLSNWKAAGIDCVYNFFIKESKCLHQYIITEMRKILSKPESAPEWFFSGLTYLIPKKTGEQAEDHRPITCMSTLYKIYTKTVAIQLRRFCEINQVLSENQL
jgi:hypothetical protein